MKKIILITVLAFFTIFGAVAYADDACIYGTAQNYDGSKIDGSAKVSTSWNDVKAFPKNGKYRLCLGSNPKKTITIYIDGNKYAELYVNGETSLDIVKR